MTRETKVGLLAGTALILLIGILVSDHLSIGPSEPADSLVNFAPDVQRSIDNGTTTTIAADAPAPTTPVSRRSEPLPLPQEMSPRETPAPAPSPTPTIVNPTPGEPLIATVAPGEPSLVNPSPAPAAPTTNWADMLAETPFLVAGSREEGRRIYHTVKANESLSQIAAEYLGSAGRWMEIRDANPGKVTAQGWVREGVRLIIPQTDLQREATDTAPATANRSTAGGSATNQPRTVTVREGETLSKLAQIHLGSTDRWQEIYDLNRDTLRSPDRVMPGMRLRLPESSAAANAGTRIDQPRTPAPAEGTYTVRSGDSLSSIAAAKLGDASRWYELYRANQARISDPDSLQVGTTLTIPR